MSTVEHLESAPARTTAAPRRHDAVQQAVRACRALMPIAFLLLVIVYFGLASENFATTTNFFNILRASSILLVIAIGATLVVVAGSVDLSVGAVAALSGTIVAVLAENGRPGFMWMVVPVGIGCGLLNGVLLVYLKLPSFLTTLGTLFMLNGLALKLTDGRVRAVRNETLHRLTNNTSFFDIPNVAYWAVAITACVSIVAYRTAFGRRVYAIGGNERVAELAGLRVRRIKLAVFMISGLCAGIAGLLLVAQGGGSSPGMGDPFLLNAIAAIVMGGTALSGGVGGPLRTVIGVFTITIVSNGMTLTQVDPNYQTIVFGLIVLFASAVTVRRSEAGSVVK